MDTLEYIESFFTDEPDAESRRIFEERIKTDPDFAENVAFYLSVQQASRELSENEKKERFKKIYKEYEVVHSDPPVRKWVFYIAAAAVTVGIIFGIYFFSVKSSPKQLASQYEKEHMLTLPVTMSGHSDSLQTGLRLFNEGKISESLVLFEKIAQSDTAIFTAKIYAGIAALRLKEYEKAMSYFEQLEIYSGLYANPAPFLQAVTLMERNQPDDNARAKQLLQKIVANDLEGREFAQEWLKKW
jgi:tetratricopeptide (TPR) repeat protein